ncbi:MULTISPECIES: sec-independent translocase [unclassified Streptomyces]|uniref:sec-independent translocase n=1 Tax=unclassified Streptomyces TaxID=2593676 RepID=UPI0022B666A3|nr:MULTISPECIES: sec-independent translocase [unclassified Streptomyces]MCZ7416697.1 sec-independent translocase [Streptomyces sp. WMMC897]MCZ7433493.1 sec-independent translocase [Streptomyces sp. WMMC1477]
MFMDIGALEFAVLFILAVLIFGPDKLPRLIQDAAGFIRKVRQFSDSARDDIRKELGPEYQDFEFQDLHPKRFAQKHLMSDDDALGLKELRESLDVREDLRALDVRKELTETTDLINGRGTPGPVRPTDAGGAAPAAGAAGSESVSTVPDLLRKKDVGSGGTPTPFDADAT